MSDMMMKYKMKKRMAKGGCADCAAGSCMAHGGEMMAKGGDVGDLKNAYHALERHREYQERKYGEPAKSADKFPGQSEQDRKKSDKLSKNRARATSAKGVTEDDVERTIKSYPRKKMAEGGDVMDDDDIVERIMRARSGEMEEPLADFESADYDVTHQMDTPDEMDYTGENSGDELGDAAVEEDEKDLVARIMKSRSKKDRMPRPA